MVFPCSSNAEKLGTASPCFSVFIVLTLVSKTKVQFMTKQEKVNFVINTLYKLYPEIPIPLDHKDPYTLLIAVLMSAQSTDVRVNKITPLLFEQADNLMIWLNLP